MTQPNLVSAQYIVNGRWSNNKKNHVDSNYFHTYVQSFGHKIVYLADAQFLCLQLFRLLHNYMYLTTVIEFFLTHLILCSSLFTHCRATPTTSVIFTVIATEILFELETI